MMLGPQQGEECGSLAAATQSKLNVCFALLADTAEVLANGSASSPADRAKADQLATEYANTIASIRRELLGAVELLADDDTAATDATAAQAEGLAELRQKAALAEERQRLAEALPGFAAFANLASKGEQSVPSNVSSSNVSSRS
eukprot:TRINITY_DN97137_c0_g1_i1.p1 TRINITY_DN97137_c0_g1~~TRINITY_DN97137_c0_g1_i1.p1  ORF type:complete len:144 (-),score=38.32 TRINITY_DN97137_c0_g1_i1:15-446(-)